MVDDGGGRELADDDRRGLKRHPERPDGEDGHGDEGRAGQTAQVVPPHGVAGEPAQPAASHDCHEGDRDPAHEEVDDDRPQLADRAAERLLAGPLTRAGRSATVAAAAVAIGLCATIGLPGVLDPNDLDARPANVPAAAGVLLALVLTFAALRVRGWGRWERPTRGDLIALAVAPVAVVLAIPWILAGIGVQTSDAVHLGNHEGIDGLLLAATAFALRRPLRRMRRTPLRPLLGAYLALIATYGLAVAADDFWMEQLQRRGAVSHGLPYVLKPGPRPAWAALLAVACVAYAVAFRVGNEPGSSTARR